MARRLRIARAVSLDAARSRMDDDGAVLSGTLYLPDAVAESFESPPDLRGTQVHI